MQVLRKSEIAAGHDGGDTTSHTLADSGHHGRQRAARRAVAGSYARGLAGR